MAIDPSEIEVGGLYEGADGMDRCVTRIQGDWCYYTVQANRNYALLSTLAGVFTRRIDQKPKEGEQDDRKITARD